MSVDVIGDVHGQFGKLEALLARLGYSPVAGVWKHATRTAVFVGDLIDRGPRQVETVELVRSMVAAGAARCILGNHEFNAIAWATPNRSSPGEFLRPRGKPGNREQHRAFLREVEGTPRHDEIIAWFKTLPLWLDLGGLRIVHACWHPQSMRAIEPLLGPGNTLTAALIEAANQPGRPEYEAIEVICKGPEIALPEGTSFKDKDGKVRQAVRVRWWLANARTYRDAAIVPRGDEHRIPDLPLPTEWQGHPYGGCPVLFGHYWFTGTPEVISDHFACLDYSAAREGPLVAYRWDGEAELRSEKLEWVRI